MVANEAALMKTSFSVAGEKIDIYRVEGFDRLSALFEYKVRARSDDQRDIDTEKFVGQMATIEIHDQFEHMRPVTGIVASVETKTDQAWMALNFVIRPLAWRLTLGHESRVYHDKSAVDIVKDVLGRNGVAARWELSRGYDTRVFTAQYRESDWNFVCRLLEQEGIYYWFDHDGAESMLILTDNSAKADDLPGGALIDYQPNMLMRPDAEAIFQMGQVSKVRTTKFTIRSFDEDNPSLLVEGAAGGGAFEQYDAPGGHTGKPGNAKLRANTSLERAKSESRRVKGRATTLRVVVGKAVEVADHKLSSMNGRFLIVENNTLWQWIDGGKTHQMDQQDDERFFDGKFEAMPMDVTFRPPRTAHRVKQAGLQSGVVVGEPGAEVHPDDKGEVRVQLHWDRLGTRDHNSGKWMRVAQRGTTSSMLLPRIGWTVLTTNTEGSVDSPMVMNRIFDAEHMPPYALPANKTRTVFKTATTPGGGNFNEIRYEDKAGSQEMYVHASKDMDILVQNDKTESVKANMVRKVGVDHKLTVGNNSLEQIAANQSITILGNETEVVGANREKLIAANETNFVAGNRSLKLGGNFENSVAKARGLTVGGSQIEACLGEIKSGAPLVNYLVGGAVIRLSPKDITEDIGTTTSTIVGDMKSKAKGAVGGALGGAGAALINAIPNDVAGDAAVGGKLETIGGAKVEVSGGGRNIKIEKSFTETVGGAMTLTSATMISDQATLKSDTVVGAQLGYESKDLCITADTKIEVVCGGAKITITASKISLEAPAIDLSDASLLEAQGAKIEQN